MNGGNCTEKSGERSAIYKPPHGIIVIGASLGGARALQIILQGLPSTFRLPIAAVLHRAKEPGAGLGPLLQKATALPVEEPEDKQPILPGHVYLAPADYHLLIEADQAMADGGWPISEPTSAIRNPKSKIRNHFALSTEEPVHRARPSIDVLFESAADIYAARAIGILLTGASADGARGLAAIKRRGGLVVVQDPATAEARAMPDAALAATAVDQVLPLEDIAPFLLVNCEFDV